MLKFTVYMASLYEPKPQQLVLVEIYAMCDGRSQSFLVHSRPYIHAPVTPLAFSHHGRDCTAGKECYGGDKGK